MDLGIHLNKREYRLWLRDKAEEWAVSDADSRQLAASRALVEHAERQALATQLETAEAARQGLQARVPLLQGSSGTLECLWDCLCFTCLRWALWILRALLSYDMINHSSRSVPIPKQPAATQDRVGGSSLTCRPRGWSRCVYSMTTTFKSCMLMEC